MTGPEHRPGSRGGGGALAPSWPTALPQDPFSSEQPGPSASWPPGVTGPAAGAPGMSGQTPGAAAAPPGVLHLPGGVLRGPGEARLEREVGEAGAARSASGSCVSCMDNPGHFPGFPGKENFCLLSVYHMPSSAVGAREASVTLLTVRGGVD